ncbi:MAG: bifunctional metallophosphatase/5'-nucleotidase [Betaproteobacteria bacterium]
MPQQRLIPYFNKRVQAAFLLTALTTALVVACGGSSNGVSVSGTAATGAAFANASVTLRCVGGSGTGKTSTDGSYAVFASGGSTPCLLEASNGSNAMHSVVASDSANVATANITPLTEQLVANLSSDTVDTTAFFAGFGASSAALLSSANVTQAQTAVFAALSSAGIASNGVTDVLKAPLVAKTSSTQLGNSYDQLLDTVAATAVPVKIIALNDFHGNFQELSLTSSGGSMVLPNGSASSTLNVGGAAYLATVVKNIRAKNANNIMVGAGDLMAASPFASAINHDESTVDILNQIGVEVSSVGNHEFDRGITELKRIQNGGCYPAANGQGVVGVDTCLMAGGTFSGAKYKYLAANVIDTSTGKPTLPATYIKRFGTVSVGFIGLTLKATPNSVSADGVSGLRFDDEVTVINTYASQLKAQGVTAVAVLIHQGGQTTATTVNDKTCPGFSGDIKSILDKLNSSVDLVVSGHTHQEYVCNYPTASGKSILLTSTGFYGQAVSEIDLTLKPSAGLVSASANTVPVIRSVNSNKVAQVAPTGFAVVEKDAAIDALVTNYVNLSKTAGNLVVGSVATDIKRALLANGKDRDESNESALADVMADSYLSGVPGYTADVAFVNPGSVRADLLKSVTGKADGAVLYSELATIEPFANNLMVLNLTGTQIIRLLEEQWETPNHTAKTNPDKGTVGRILGVSKGFTYTYDNSVTPGAAKGSGARVVSGSVKLNGVAIDPAKTYKVVTNSYLATGTAPDNFTTMAQQGANKLDTKIMDLDAFVAYFKANANLSSPATRVTRLN